MAKDVTYKVCGVSRRNGEIKVRFSHDMMYVKCLAKVNHTDIQLFEAPALMSKFDLVEWLKTTELYQNDEYRAAIDDRAEFYAPKELQEPKVKKVKAEKPAKIVKIEKPSMESIKARIPKNLANEETIIDVDAHEVLDASAE